MYPIPCHAREWFRFRSSKRAEVRILPEEDGELLLDASRLGLLEHCLGNENDVGVWIGDSPHETACVGGIPAQDHCLHALHRGQIDGHVGPRALSSYWSNSLGKGSVVRAFHECSIAGQLLAAIA